MKALDSVLLLIILFSNASVVFISASTLAVCPIYCSCDLTSNVLTITCTQTSPTFNLPDPSVNTQLYGVAKIVVKNAQLQNYPSNICQYRQYLTWLDLSLNQITGTLNTAYLSCLTNLQYLNMSNNYLSAIQVDAFDNCTFLNTIDLNVNKITDLPTELFDKKQSQLKYLYLRNNLLTTLDPWYFYLSSIDTIDLSFNYIASLTNNIKWTLYGQSFFSQGRAVVNIDLSYNKLTKFDDTVLQFYSLCTRQDIVYYLQLLYKLNLNQNPFDCSCQSSYNLLSFVQQSISITALDPNNIVFNAACQTPAKYKGLSIFTFANTNTDTLCIGSTPFTAGINCPLVTTTTTTTTTTTSKITFVSTLKTFMSALCKSGLEITSFSGVLSENDHQLKLVLGVINRLKILAGQCDLLYKL